jgi:hypothetical protein
MPVGRRLVVLLTVLGLVALPAVALRVFCVGKSCDTGDASAAAAVPFCPLPAELRAEIAAGFREGRSPDVMAATAGSDVATELPAGGSVAWPTAGSDPIDTRVPIAFFGTGVDPGSIPAGTGLDQIAPTLAEVLQYRRPHPEVRAGQAIDGAVAAGASAPDIVIEIAWDGVGTPDLEARPHAWPFLRSALRAGAGTLRGETGSIPLDPAATLTTIGTGGLPSQHGITGSMIRGDDGEIATSWGLNAPGSIISTLPDDLDRDSDQRARIAAVLAEGNDRGIVGDGWYVDVRDRDDRIVTDTPVAAVGRLLDAGYGSNGNPSIIGVTVRDSVTRMDRATQGIVRAVRARVPDSTFVVTTTGSLAGPGAITDVAVERRVETATGSPVVAASSAGGFFLDREVSTERGTTADDVATAMRAMRGPDGAPMFADAFPAFAVAFSRYC